MRSLGFADPYAALGAIRGLDNVTSIRHSKTATRNLLANLLAAILGEIAECGAPTPVLNRLEQVVARTGGVASLYRSLLENDQLRGRLLLALDAGDLFAQRLGRYPELLDFLVTASLDMDGFRCAIAESLAQLKGQSLAASADPFRRFKAIEEFKAIAEWLVSRSLPTLNRKLSLVADTALAWSGEHAEIETLIADDGSGGGAWGIYALGKLGGRELTAHSDLDLVFLYEGDPRDSPGFVRHQAFVRAVQAFLEQPTAAGYAYRLDTDCASRARKALSRSRLARSVGTWRRELRYGSAWPGPAAGSSGGAEPSRLRSLNPLGVLFAGRGIPRSQATHATSESEWSTSSRRSNLGARWISRLAWAA